MIRGCGGNLGAIRRPAVPSSLLYVQNNSPTVRSNCTYRLGVVF